MQRSEAAQWLRHAAVALGVHRATAGEVALTNALMLAILGCNVRLSATERVTPWELYAGLAADAKALGLREVRQLCIFARRLERMCAESE